MPLVSVIIPNYNHAHFLKDRIESVLGQTYQNIEIIILDDASNDKSQEIINIYKNQQQISHIIFNESNTGSPFFQWAKGLELAIGKYVWIAESDDYAKSTFLEKCVKKLENDYSLALAFCKTALISENNEILKYKEPEQTSGKYHAIIDGFMYNWYFNNDPFRILNASACIFRRDFMEKNMVKEIREYKYSGDKFFWLSLLSKHPDFYYISYQLNYQRNHNNTTRAKRGLNSEYIRNSELLKIYMTYQTNGFYLDKKANMEIGRRMLAKNIYRIFLWRFPNIIQLLKSVYLTRFDLKYYKKILRVILLEKDSKET